MNNKRFAAVLILAASLVGGSVLILSATAQTRAQNAEPPRAADDPYQKIFNDQIMRTKRYEALLAQQEELMKRQEAACTRYISILDRWEKQQQQFQKYLDSLGKK